MFKVLVQAEVVPAYTQVAVFDVDNNESYPQWDTDRTDYTSGPAGVAVITQDDLDGPVKVVVASGSPPADKLLADGMEKICEVSISLAEARLGLGSIVADDVHVVDIGPGKHTVSIFGNVGRERRANSLLIALDA